MTSIMKHPLQHLVCIAFVVLPIAVPAGDSGLPEMQRVTRVSYPNPYKTDAPLVPSGLLGPVTIQTVKKEEKHLP
jgi:hypothetical protein